MEKEIVRELVTFKNTEKGRKNLVEGEIYKLEMDNGDLSVILQFVKYDPEYGSRRWNNLPLRFKIISTNRELTLGSDGLVGWDLEDDNEVFTRLTYDNE